MEIFEQLLQKYRKPILIVISVIIIGVIGYNIAIFISRIGKLPVLVAFAPFDATVTINGEEYKNNQTHYLKPGEYQVEASHEHFETMILEYVLEENSSENNFVGGLIPNDDEGFTIANNRKSEYLKIERISGLDASKEAEKFFEEAPIAQYLPINYNAYSVSYNYDDQNNFYVELVLKKGIEYSPQAVATLYSLSDDISPANYRVITRDYKNPFGEFKQNTESNISKYLETGYDDDFKNYQVLTNRIINQDDYYGVLIIPKDADTKSDAAAYPIYRVILKKEGSSWKMVNEPYFVVSQYNAAEVPVDFLDRLNRTFVETDI